jgi:hypothetical protein
MFKLFWVDIHFFTSQVAHRSVTDFCNRSVSRTCVDKHVLVRQICIRFDTALFTGNG